MISLSAVVSVVITLIIAMVVFGLLLWLIGYVAAQFPGVAPFAGVAKVILAIFAVLMLIGVILSATSGQSVFRP